MQNSMENMHNGKGLNSLSKIIFQRLTITLARDSCCAGQQKIIITHLLLSRGFKVSPRKSLFQCPEI